MTDLVLRSFNGEMQKKSYGNNTLATNFSNAQEAIDRVRYTEKIWDRSRSQWMLKFLTCSNADGWLRMRQIGAEMDRKRMALTGGKFSYLKSLTEAKILRKEMLEEDDEDKRLLLEIESAEKESNARESLVKIEGCLKEIETLGDMHDTLKAKLGEITEEEFEKAQTKAHIKRAVMQAIREVKECGKIRTGNAEYLEQSGLSTTAVLRDIFDFLKVEEQSGVGDTSVLHAFLDETANKYEGAAIQQAEWLGFDPDANMNLTFEP